MIGFLVGAVAGGLTVWLWGEELRRYTNARARDARVKAADGLHSMQDKAGEMLDTAKEHVSSTLQAGQDALRPRVHDTA